MTKLFVLGNGFDIQHGLKTSYWHFRQYLKEGYPQLENSITEIFDEYLSIYNYVSLSDEEFENNDEIDVMWNHFEESLAFFDIQFFDEQVDYSLMGGFPDEEWHDSYWHDAQYQLDEETLVFKKLKAAFVKWIATLYISSDIRCGDISTDDLFITFNYTDTLEKLYNISSDSIFHVHGQMGGEVIIGHEIKYSDEFKHLQLDPNGNEPLYDPNNEDFRIEELREIISSRVDAFYKPIKDEILPKLNKWLESRDEPNEIVVFGHSYGKVDWEYFRYLKKRFPKASWCYGCYSDTDKQNLKAMMSIVERKEKID